METATSKPSLDLLHTEEQIKYYCNLHKQAVELSDMAKKYSNPELKILSDKYLGIVQKELDKYNHLIGVVCYAPAQFMSTCTEDRIGVVEAPFYFNDYSKSVRCYFRYGLRGTDGFDGKAIKQLKYNNHGRNSNQAISSQ